MFFHGNPIWLHADGVTIDDGSDDADTRWMVEPGDVDTQWMMMANRVMSALTSYPCVPWTANNNYNFHYFSMLASGVRFVDFNTFVPQNWFHPLLDFDFRPPRNDFVEDSFFDVFP